MALHPFRSAAATEAGVVEDTLLEAIVERTALVLERTESLADFTQSTGEIALCVIHAATGYLYFYDETDATTADDGITCLVDGSGHRYHLQDSASVSLGSVLGLTNTPAVGPSVGDAYICGVSPTGAWSAHASDVAVYTRRGWVFVQPNVGMTVLREDTGTNWQYDEAGAWGAFATSLDAGAVLPKHLQFAMGLAVEDFLNTPPGSPSAGQFWIVGTVPTGAFVGHANDLAYYEGGAWAFVDVYEGAVVADRDSDELWVFTAGSWGSLTDFVAASLTQLGHFQKIGSASTPSAVAQLDFTSLSAYRVVRLFGMLTPATDDVELRVRMLVGGSPDTGASAYAYASNWGVHSGAHGSQTSTAAAFGLVADDVGSATGEGIVFDLLVINLNQGQTCMVIGVAGDTGGGAQVGSWTAHIIHLGTSARDGLRLYFSSGNIQDGVVWAEGVLG